MQPAATKWFCGPKEVGLLYVKRNRIAEIWPNLVSPGWGSDVDPDVKGARKFESLRPEGRRSPGRDCHDRRFSPPDRLRSSRGPDLRACRSAEGGDEGRGPPIGNPEDSRLSGGVCIIPGARRKSAGRYSTVSTLSTALPEPPSRLALVPPHLQHHDPHQTGRLATVRDMRSIIG